MRPALWSYGEIAGLMLGDGIHKENVERIYHRLRDRGYFSLSFTGFAHFERSSSAVLTEARLLDAEYRLEEP